MIAESPSRHRMLQRRSVRKIGWIAALAVLATAMGGFAMRAKNWRPLPKARWNVVLIVLDTTRADHLSCYGYTRPTTPQLERFCQEATRFTNCVAVSNWTLPTHASLLTGLYPRQHGARILHPAEDPAASTEHFEGKLPEEAQTLAERLREANYQTAAICANFGYLHRRFRLDQGFQHYDARPAAVQSVVSPWRTAAQITDEALRWLNAVKHDQPYFLMLNYMDPHHPYNPPPEYLQRVCGRPSEDAEPKRASYFQEMISEVSLSGKPLSKEERTMVTDRYDGELAYVDDHVGRLLSHLRKDSDAWNRTVVIVTADHGEALGEHTVLGHSFRLYEPEVAIPMILKLPAQSSPRVDLTRASQVDVLPTVLELVGLTLDKSLPGRSLLAAPSHSILTGKELDPRMTSAIRPLNGGQLALYQGPFKYIQYENGPAELFRIERDPAEEHNLTRGYENIRQECKQSLERLQAQWSPRWPVQLSAPPQDYGEDINALRELGYAQ